MKRLKTLFIQLLYHNSIYVCKIKRYHKGKESSNFRSVRRFYLGTKRLDYFVYRLLTDDLLDEFGVTAETKRIFYIEKHRLQMICRYYINDDKSLIGKIMFKTKELEDEKKRQKSLVQEDVKKLHSRNYRVIRKWSGCENIKEITIFEFYNYFKDYEEERKNDKAA